MPLTMFKFNTFNMMSSSKLNVIYLSLGVCLPFVASMKQSIDLNKNSNLTIKGRYKPRMIC